MAAITLHVKTSTFPSPLFAGILRLIQYTPLVHGNLHVVLSE